MIERCMEARDDSGSIHQMINRARKSQQAKRSAMREDWKLARNEQAWGKYEQIRQNLIELHYIRQIISSYIKAASFLVADIEQSF